MTRLLEGAIADLRDLPEDEQDLAADVIFAYLARDDQEQHDLHTASRPGGGSN
jgi:hypothetical protein